MQLYEDFTSLFLFPDRCGEGTGGGGGSLPHVGKDTIIPDCRNGSWDFREIHVPCRMSGRNLSNVYFSDVVLYPDWGESFPTAWCQWGAVWLQTGIHQQDSAVSVIAQDLPGVCALKVSATCDAKLSVRVKILNQECASKKSETLISHNVCWDQQLVKLCIIVTVCWAVLEWLQWREAVPSEQVLCSVFTCWLQTTCEHLLC
jgi:hypothetical protein